MNRNTFDPFADRLKGEQAKAAIRSADAIERIAVAAAESSAVSSDAAKIAAQAAQKSARWTMIAAFVAAFGAVCSSIDPLLRLAEHMHWMK